MGQIKPPSGSLPPLEPPPLPPLPPPRIGAVPPSLRSCGPVGENFESLDPHAGTQERPARTPTTAKLAIPDDDRRMILLRRPSIVWYPPTLNAGQGW